MRKRYCLATGLLCFGGLGAEAQLNESDTTAFQVRASVTGVHQRGNVSYQALRGNATLVARLSENVAFALCFLSTNLRRKLDLRYFAGVGITGQLVRRPRHVLKLSAGFVYETSQFAESTFNNDAYTGDRRITVTRATVCATGWHYLGEQTVRLYYGLYGQPSLADRANYRIHLNLGTDIKLGKHFSATALYSFSHESIVVVDVLRNDGLLTFGLTYTL